MRDALRREGAVLRHEGFLQRGVQRAAVIPVVLRPGTVAEQPFVHRAAVGPEEARRGRLSDWLFVGLIMLALLLLLVGTLTVAWWILSFTARNLPSVF